MHQFLHYVATITFFSMSAKHNISSQSTFNIALKTLEKSPHFMLTHVHIRYISLRCRFSTVISILIHFHFFISLYCILNLKYKNMLFISQVQI